MMIAKKSAPRGYQLHNGVFVVFTVRNKLLESARSVRYLVLRLDGHSSKRHLHAIRNENGVPSKSTFPFRWDDSSIGPPNKHKWFGTRARREGKRALAVCCLILLPCQEIEQPIVPDRGDEPLDVRSWHPVECVEAEARVLHDHARLHALRRTSALLSRDVQRLPLQLRQVKVHVLDAEWPQVLIGQNQVDLLLLLRVSRHEVNTSLVHATRRHLVERGLVLDELRQPAPVVRGPRI
mmetsp:Transcript_40536/g.93053  ORF Transcript_40536/g.93053 Transcript_40536/m.93053 type:complete len:237 (-) Transcript_40536:14-724(-)